MNSYFYYSYSCTNVYARVVFGLARFHALSGPSTPVSGTFVQTSRESRSRRLRNMSIVLILKTCKLTNYLGLRLRHGMTLSLSWSHIHFVSKIIPRKTVDPGGYQTCQQYFCSNVCATPPNAQEQEIVINMPEPEDQVQVVPTLQR